MFQHVSTISTFLERFAEFWCFLRDVSSSGYCLDQFKTNCLPPNLEVFVLFLPARHDASKMPKVVVLKVAVALPSPTCPEGVLPRYHWVNWSPSGWWVTVPLDPTPKKGGNSWISNDNSTHINSTIFIYKKYPRILVLLKVYHGVGDLVSINNMQFHRLSWSHLNSFGACYFNWFGALLEAALEVGLGRSATWDLWVIYWKHGHKWNNTRTKKTRKWEKWSSISHRFF